MRHVLSLCFLAMTAAALLAQTPRVALLEIEIDKTVSYRLDISDPAKLATAGTIVPPPIANRGFLGFIGLGDIVAVNGKPAKGLWANRGEILNPAPNPAPTMAMANVPSGNHTLCAVDLFTADGVWVGKLSDRGLAGNPSTHPVIGGSGAFLGAVGEHGWATTVTPMRTASVSEDPSLRQSLGGGKIVARYYLIPKQWPEVEVTADGPAVFHSGDWSPVTAAKPARAGETLVVRAKGLGPTRPDLIPAGYKPFGQDPAEEVNSPVEASIGGKAAEVLNKIGWPGAYDLYRVDVRVPSGVAPGTTTLQLTAAWITGPEVKIPVQ